MKYPCGVIHDLLPLVHDDACSPESRRAVEEHCADCPDCKKLLDELNAAPEPSEMVKEANQLLPIRKKWNREKKKYLWIGLGIALLLTLAYTGYSVLRSWQCVPMGKDDVVVLDIYQTADGIVHIDYDDLYDLNFYSTPIELGSDGCGYISAYRPILARRKEGPYHRNSYAGVSFDPESAFVWLDDELYGPHVSVDKVYIGIKDDPENCILAWKKGMEVRAATEEEEEFYRTH